MEISGASNLSEPVYGASIRESLFRFAANVFNFQGKASRTEFWVVFFTLVIISFPISAIDLKFDTNLQLVFAVAFFLPTLTLICRRLHDAGLPGAFVVVGLIPVVGQVGLLLTMLLPPKNPTADPATASQQAPYQNLYTDPASNPDQ